MNRYGRKGNKTGPSSMRNIGGKSPITGQPLHGKGGIFDKPTAGKPLSLAKNKKGRIKLTPKNAGKVIINSTTIRPINKFGNAVNRGVDALNSPKGKAFRYGASGKVFVDGIKKAGQGVSKGVSKTKTGVKKIGKNIFDMRKMR